MIEMAAALTGGIIGVGVCLLLGLLMMLLERTTGEGEANDAR